MFILVCTCVPLIHLALKSLNGQAPEYLSSLLTKSSETNTRNLHSSEQEILKVPFAQTAYYKKSFPVTDPNLWNTLPLEIRKSTSLATFKMSVKKYVGHSKSNAICSVFLCIFI